MNFRPAALALTVLLLGAAPVMAASPNPPTPTLSTADQATVERATAYLQGLTSAKGRFVQTDQKGGRATGTLYLDRPGRARFEYDPPAGLLITSDGRTITISNSRLKSQQRYPLSATPLGLFLGKEIRLDRGVRVVGVTPTAGGFSITATDVHGAAQGQIVLSFADGPLRLAGWTIIDGQRRATRVDLEDFAPAGDLPATLFIQPRP